MSQRIEQVRGDRGHGAEMGKRRLKSGEDPGGIGKTPAVILAAIAHDARADAIGRAAGRIVEDVCEDSVVIDSIPRANDGLAPAGKPVPEVRCIGKTDSRSKVILVALLLGRKNRRKSGASQALAK